MDKTKAADEPIFRALLVPHRSLGRTGFFVLMGIIVTIWLIISAVFLAMGAWPVFGFFGLDVLLLYFAFRMNYRAARAHEEVFVSRLSLDIIQVAPSGRKREHHFNPFWTKLRIARHDEIGITEMTVEGRGHKVAIGTFLNPDDRESFARAFGQALATAKAG